MSRQRILLRLAGIISGISLSANAVAGDIVAMTAPGAAPLTKEQIESIYLGRTLDYKPVDLPEGNEVRNDFYKKLTGRDASQVKAVWSRLIFTGHAQAPKVLADGAAVKKAVAADPKLVGYIDKDNVDSTVKVVLTLN